MNYDNERRGGEEDLPYRDRGRLPRNGRPNASNRRDRPRGGRGKVKTRHLVFQKYIHRTVLAFKIK